LLPDNGEIVPIISPILEAAKGIGFTNVYVDPDGVRRRVELLKRYGDGVFPQLVFGPVLDYLGQPQIRVEPGAVVLENARFADGTVATVRIPRAQDGRVLIDWPHGSYQHRSFRHVSFKQLYVHNVTFSRLVANLRSRAS
jgi:adenylate cyclase